VLIVMTMTGVPGQISNLPLMHEAVGRGHAAMRMRTIHAHSDRAKCRHAYLDDQ
jgi:hypothetical protein